MQIEPKTKLMAEELFFRTFSAQYPVKDVDKLLADCLKSAIDYYAFIAASEASVPEPVRAAKNAKPNGKPKNGGDKKSNGPKKSWTDPKLSGESTPAPAKEKRAAKKPAAVKPLRLKRKAKK